MAITTRAEGFSLGSSKRATDLLLKIDTLADRYPGKPIVSMFTGTPWSNTLAETFVWQKYLQPDRLAEAGVEHFDSWAATFVKYESKVEVTPDGSGFRLYRRPSAIQNVPELRLMFAAVADLLTPEAIGLERPDATWENIVTQPGNEQAAFMQQLAARADAIRNYGSKAQRPDGNGDDNMLLVCNDGRRVALDPRLVGIDEDSRKVEAAAQKIFEHYKRDKARMYGDSTVPGTAQLVLCDIGTPRPDDSQVYGRLRSRLVQLGIPMKAVRFIHEAKTDKARDHLFSQVREGSVSVLLGSTDKVGVGTNIQTRLSVLHHLDAPWRPSDIQQREGRGLRPGNLNDHVSIYRYLSEGSFDAFLWQTIERKMRFISQMFVVDGAIREIEDVSEAVMTFAEVKALAAGNPQLLRQAEISNTIRRLRTMRSVWSQSVKRLQDDAKGNRSSAESYRARADGLVAAFVDVEKHRAIGPSPDETAAFADSLKTNRAYPSAMWFGLDLGRAVRYEREAKKGGQPVDVEIKHKYRVIGEFTLSKSDMRLPEDELGEVIAERVEAWYARSTGEPARLVRMAAACDAAADEANAVADASSFEQSGALAEAERELAEVDAAIAASVEDSTQAAAAAVAPVQTLGW